MNDQTRKVTLTLTVDEVQALAVGADDAILHGAICNPPAMRDARDKMWMAFHEATEDAESLAVDEYLAEHEPAAPKWCGEDDGYGGDGYLCGRINGHDDAHVAFIMGNRAVAVWHGPEGFERLMENEPGYRVVVEAGVAERVANGVRP